MSDTEINSLTSGSIRDLFFGDTRREFAEHLVFLYGGASKTEQKSLISKLNGAIILSPEDTEQRYRVNLYIALTFYLLSTGVTDKNDQSPLEVLKNLRKSEEYKKPTNTTFRQNIDHAIAKQSSS